MQLRKAAHRFAHANFKWCRRQVADHALDGRVIQRRRNWNWRPAEGHQIAPGVLVDNFHDPFDADGLAVQIENVSAGGLGRLENVKRANHIYESAGYRIGFASWNLQSREMNHAARARAFES